MQFKKESKKEKKPIFSFQTVNLNVYNLPVDDVTSSLLARRVHVRDVRQDEVHRQPLGVRRLERLWRLGGRGAVLRPADRWRHRWCRPRRRLLRRSLRLPRHLVLQVQEQRLRGGRGEGR